MPTDASAVSDAFVAARTALSAARERGEIGGLEWSGLIIGLRDKMDKVAVGSVTPTEAIAHFNEVAEKYLALMKEDKL